MHGMVLQCLHVLVLGLLGLVVGFNFAQVQAEYCPKQCKNHHPEPQPLPSCLANCAQLLELVSASYHFDQVNLSH